jgi:hypothetical protein
LEIVMLARIRKSVVAGIGAGAVAAAGVVGKALQAGVFDDTAVQQAIGAFIFAAAVVGRLTWRVPNTPAQR